MLTRDRVAHRPITDRRETQPKRRSYGRRAAEGLDKCAYSHGGKYIHVTCNDATPSTRGVNRVGDRRIMLP